MSLSSENLRPRFPFGDTSDPSSCCARGVWGPCGLLPRPSPPRDDGTHPPRVTPSTCLPSSRGPELLRCFLTSPPSSNTPKFSEQSVPGAPSGIITHHPPGRTISCAV